MAKRRIDKNNIAGYLHTISQTGIKVQKYNNRYFEGKFQTDSKHLQRLVVFTPDKHQNYRSAETLGKPLKLVAQCLQTDRKQKSMSTKKQLWK